jgi:energy-coupling factor transporter ATP-binding protein EcfA2
MISAVSGEALRVERGARRLFEDLSFGVRAGEALALTGPNGAGKTSLLRCLAGLLRPNAGALRFESAAGALEPEAARAGGLHWLGSQDGLKGQRTARAELAFWTRWAGGSEDAVGPALEALGLSQQAGAGDAPPLLGPAPPPGPGAAGRGAATALAAGRAPGPPGRPLARRSRPADGGAPDGRRPDRRRGARSPARSGTEPDVG